MEIQHPYHPEHPLILLPKSPNFFNLFECKGCHLYSNGFSYNCSICNFNLDVQCGSLLATIKHDRDPIHILSLKGNISKRCKACYKGWSKPILAYACNHCDFVIDSCCALLSKEVMHRYDEHPFILTYFPVKDHSVDYYCQLCEKELNPKWWFYHCAHCDRSIHIKCLRPFYRRANIKYGRTLNINDSFGRTSKVGHDSGSSDVIHFPVVDQSVTLISYFLKGTNIVTEDETANQVLNHFSHDHPLILEVQDSDSESSSKRKLCLMNDTRVDETICDACVRPIFATPFYRHRYDEHYYILTYKPVKDHSHEYYCDLCEGELNPKTWFYHCVDCDRSIHIKCLRPFYGSANIMYGAGRSLEIERQGGGGRGGCKWRWWPEVQRVNGDGFTQNLYKTIGDALMFLVDLCDKISITCYGFVLHSKRKIYILETNGKERSAKTVDRKEASEVKVVLVVEVGGDGEGEKEGGSGDG
ncbi:hypothetical protein LguiB_004283 [Lonicera macranthoides]